MHKQALAAVIRAGWHLGHRTFNLRELAKDGLIVRPDPDQAVYRLT